MAKTKQIRGMPKGVVVLDKTEALKAQKERERRELLLRQRIEAQKERERRERLLRQRIEAQKRADGEYLSNHVVPMLGLEQVWGGGYKWVSSGGYGVQDQLIVRTKLGLDVLIYRERGRLHTRLCTHFPSQILEECVIENLDDLPAQLKRYDKAVDTTLPWIQELRLNEDNWEERIFWKEARLAGYDVVPGYALIHLIHLGADKSNTRWLASVRFIDTGISAYWHVQKRTLNGGIWESWCFETMEEALDRVNRF